jgi:ribosomal protein S18 acetylase RimI-like enzyme
VLAASHGSKQNKTNNSGFAGNSQRQPTPVIREAREDDFDKIMEIENACFPGELAYSREQMRYLLFRANSEALVEEAGGNVTGYVAALFRKNSQIAGIETIGVRPAFRGRGVGKRLLSAAEERMARKGANISRLEVSSGNDAAIAMYEKAGYQVTGTMPEYYIYEHDGTREAHRMEKRLRPKKY